MNFMAALTTGIGIGIGFAIVDGFKVTAKNFMRKHRMAKTMISLERRKEYHKLLEYMLNQMTSDELCHHHAYVENVKRNIMQQHKEES